MSTYTERLQKIVGCPHRWTKGDSRDIGVTKRGVHVSEIEKICRLCGARRWVPFGANMGLPDRAPNVSRLWGALTAAGKRDVNVDVRPIGDPYIMVIKRIGADYEQTNSIHKTEPAVCEAVARIVIDELERREKENAHVQEG